MNVTIKAQKQLTSVPEFERILLRVNPDGSAVRLRDVARVELGQESYTSSARYNGKPAAGRGHQAGFGRQRPEHVKRGGGLY